MPKQAILERLDAKVDICLCSSQRSGIASSEVLTSAILGCEPGTACDDGSLELMKLEVAAVLLD